MTMSEVRGMCVIVCFSLAVVIAITTIVVLAIVKNHRENNPTKCSLCGGDDLGEYLIFKAKKRWYGWGETGLDRKTICICEECQKSLQVAAKVDRKSREKEED